MKLGFINLENTSILSHLLGFAFHAHFWNTKILSVEKNIPKVTQGKPLSQSGSHQDPLTPTSAQPLAMQHPSKIQAMTEPHKGEKQLPVLDKIPCTWSVDMPEFIKVIRSACSLLLVGEQCVVCVSTPILEVCNSEKGEDGVPCVVCASHETSGTKVLVGD